MADQRKSGIAWTEETWNPTRGCSLVSTACLRCYAIRQAARMAAPGQAYEGLVRNRENGGPVWTGKVRLVPGMLDAPLRWRRPRRVFVDSMSDLFHEKLRDEEIAAVFGVMAACPQHTFQVLTKRAERMRRWFEWAAREDQRYGGAGVVVSDALLMRSVQRAVRLHGIQFGGTWPLPNVWLGVSVEDQATADKRIPHLLATPAAVRFVSYEPALGPVDFARWLPKRGVSVTCTRCGRRKAPRGRLAPLATAGGLCDHHDCQGYWEDPQTGDLWPGEFRRDFGFPTDEANCAVLDMIIVGGESGPGARPFDLAWARSPIADCRAAKVACFVKQDSGRQPGQQGRFTDEEWAIKQWPDTTGERTC